MIEKTIECVCVFNPPGQCMHININNILRKHRHSSTTSLVQTSSHAHVGGKGGGGAIPWTLSAPRQSSAGRIEGDEENKDEHMNVMAN